MKSNKTAKTFSTSFYVVVVSILFTFVLFETYISQNAKNVTISAAPEPTIKAKNINNAPVAKTTAAVSPIEVASLKPNDVVTSPLKLAGKVDSSWMSKGTFTVKLLDENRKVVSTTLAKETVKGSSAKPGKIDFVADVAFKTAARAGYLVLESAGTQKTQYEMPVKFAGIQANLKTYSNESLKFSFKYPSIVSLKTQKTVTDILNLQLNGDLNFYVSSKGIVECESGCPKIYQTETVTATNATFTKYYLAPTKQISAKYPNALSYLLETKYQGKVYGLSVLVTDRTDVNGLRISNETVSGIINSLKFASQSVSVTPAKAN